jgi:deazaflavin-dependent oxidoreductase (nitroreductase family)
VAGTDFAQALGRTRELELTITGRKSGRESSRTVWFVHEGDRIYLLPVSGSDTQWYRNVLRTPAVRLAAGGAEHRATATPLTDPARVDEVVDAFRAKYGARDVAAYYPKHDVAVELPLA